MTHITTEVDDGPIIRLAFNVGVEDIHLLSGEELSNKSIFTVFLNGNIIGVVKNYNKLVDTFKQARRCGFIKEFVSIYAHLKVRKIYFTGLVQNYLHCNMDILFLTSNVRFTDRWTF